MGQRSQIYVRFPVDNGYDGKKGYGLIANYYQWNYGERMISRCRYALEFIRDASIQEYLHWYFGSNYEKFRRYLDVNFDKKDIMISTDIIKEYVEFWEECSAKCKDEYERDFNYFVFDGQDNNNGKLLIDIRKDVVKYVFLGREAYDSDVMDAEGYMVWDNNETWRNREYIDVKTCEENIEAINGLAELMTEDEVKDFLNCKYENEPKLPLTSEK